MSCGNEIGMEGLMADSWSEITADLTEVFRYDKEERPQDRAHAYLERRVVPRGFGDTAMQCAASDLCRRAYALGQVDARAGMSGVQSCAASLTEMSGRMLALAVELRGMELKGADAHGE